MAVTANRRYLSLIALTVAAHALAGARPVAQVNRPGGPVVLFSSFPGGVADGQKVVATLFNSEPEALTFFVQAVDEDGNPLATTADVEVPPGEFRSAGLSRADLPVAGDRDTGRVQADMQVWLISRRDRYLRSSLPLSMEIVDVATGKTRAGVQLTIKPNDLEPPDPSAFSTLIGLARGDVLEITQRNPAQPGQPIGQPVIFTVTVTSDSGVPLATSPEVTIPPGGFRTIRFNRDDLPIAGEPGTSRAQVRTIPLWGSRGRMFDPPTLQLVDATGQTRDLRRGATSTFVDLEGWVVW